MHLTSSSVAVDHVVHDFFQMCYVSAMFSRLTRVSLLEFLHVFCALDFVLAILGFVS